jgi:phage gp29-like protein
MCAAAPERIIAPASDDRDAKRHADFIRDVWGSLEEKSRLIHDLLSAIGRGFSIAEMMFEVGEGSLVVSRVKVCPPSLFSFMDSGNPGRILDFPDYSKPGEVRGTAIPRGKFIFHTHRSFAGGPLRAGIYRGIAWYYLFTNFSIKDWMSFMDIYGIPLRLGKFKSTADDRSREVLKKAVMELGSDAAAVISEDTTIEFIESRLSGSHDLFQNAVEFFNRQKSKRVLGQTLTTEQGQSGSYALGDVHDRVRNDITRLDCILLDETLTRDFAVPLIKANFGRQKSYPRFTSKSDKRREHGDRLDDLKKLYDMGVPLAVGQLYRAAGIPEPAPADSVIVNTEARR